MDQRVFGVGGEVGELGERLAVPREARGVALAALGLGAAAEVGASAEAVGAVAAEDREAHDHVVAGLEVGDEFAGLFDDAGGLVAEDAGRVEGVEAFDEVEVGVADAGGGGLDEDFARAGLVDVDLFDREVLIRSVEHCGFHRVVLPRPAAHRRRAGRSLGESGRGRTVVPGEGFEPPRPQGPADFKSAAAASYAIPAHMGMIWPRQCCVRYETVSPSEKIEIVPCSGVVRMISAA